MIRGNAPGLETSGVYYSEKMTVVETRVVHNRGGVQGSGGSVGMFEHDGLGETTSTR